MPKRHLILAAVIAPALLAGCAGANYGVESIHQPVVGRASYAFDVNAGYDGLSAGEQQRLAGWMASLRPGYGDSVAIDGAGQVSPDVRRDVQQIAARYGLLVADDAPMTDAPLPTGVVRVVVSRSQASVPGCPDYRGDKMPKFDERTSSNYGCALNANVAAMVANPLDLVRGAPGVRVTDPATGTRAIDSWRKAAPTGAGGTQLKQESTAGGAR